jgi:Zn finger protein HypA/HybF involved in hydrogenase expression
MAELRGDQADIVCNDCGAVVQNVPAGEAQNTLIEMSSGEVATAKCPHCGSVNVFDGSPQCWRSFVKAAGEVSCWTKAANDV